MASGSAKKILRNMQAFSMVYTVLILAFFLSLPYFPEGSQLISFVAFLAISVPVFLWVEMRWVRMRRKIRRNVSQV